MKVKLMMHKDVVDSYTNSSLKVLANEYMYCFIIGMPG